jgi:hypothetical protein
LPLTETDVALTLDHESVAEPGAVAVVGLALMDAATAAGALIVTVWEIVPDRAPLESTASAV